MIYTVIQIKLAKLYDIWWGAAVTCSSITLSGTLRVSNAARRSDDTVLVLHKVLCEDVWNMPTGALLVAKLSGCLVDSLEMLKRPPLSGSPRIITCKVLDIIFIFFCWCELLRKKWWWLWCFSCGTGGVIISCFGLQVEADRLQAWFESGRQNLVVS